MASGMSDAFAQWASDFTGIVISGSDGAENGPGADGASALPGATKKNATKQTQPPTTVINFDGDTIDGMDVSPKAVAELVLSISTRAKANANEAGTMILRACVAFKAYAEKKLDDTREEAGSLLKSLVVGISAVVLGTIGAEVVAAMAISNVIVKKLAEAGVKKLIDTAKQATEESHSNKAQEQAINSLCVAANDSAMACEQIIKAHLETYLNEVVKAAQKHSLTEEQHAFIIKFVGAPPDKVDAYLAQAGVPNPSVSKQLYLAVYQHLVERFELGVVRTDMNKNREMEFASDVGRAVEIKRRARDRGYAARSKRFDEMAAQGI
jgi:hypothetical protein